MRLSSLPLAALLVSLPLLAHAAASSPPAGTVEVTHAWIRTPVPGAKVAAAYFDVTSAQAARVVAVATDAATSASLHKMEMDGDVMRMRALDALPLPAGQPVSLAPSGNHVMLEGLTRPLKSGDTVQLVLQVEDAAHHRQAVHVKAAVAPTAPK